MRKNIFQSILGSAIFAVILILAQPALAVKRVPDNSANLQPIPGSSSGNTVQPNITGNVNFDENQENQIQQVPVDDEPTPEQQPDQNQPAPDQQNQDQPQQDANPINAADNAEQAQLEKDASDAHRALFELQLLSAILLASIVLMIYVIIRINLNYRKEKSAEEAANPYRLQ